MKLWGGRFQKDENEIMEDFNSSLKFDKRLYKQDIYGSVVHVKMLTKCNILLPEEGEKIIDGLTSILDDIESGNLIIEGNYEDIHSFVEINLIKRIGDVGKKLHTARSRNDQVALDMKLYAKEYGLQVMKYLDDIMKTIEKISSKGNTMMPGYTHLQRAQVVTFNHHIKAYYQMFNRDKKRMYNCIDLLDESPLGCCALAGTTYEIDRNYTSDKLGFKKPVDNFIDGVSDRDYIVEMISVFSIIMMHLSRLCEELILWNSQEFKFIIIDDSYCTGSSIMPQKKNPDAAELIRGKTGRVYGDLISILTTLKGLPLAYNKDMQEDKHVFFDALDTVMSCLKITNEMLKTLKINKENMKKAIKEGFLNATEVADYLVNKGVAFRDAHKIVGEIVLLCESKNITIEDLTMEEYKDIDDKFEQDIYNYIDPSESLKKGIKKKMLNIE